MRQQNRRLSACAEHPQRGKAAKRPVAVQTRPMLSVTYDLRRGAEAGLSQQLVRANGEPANANVMGLQCQVETLHCVGTTVFQSVHWVAANTNASYAICRGQLEHVARNRRQRRAGSNCSLPAEEPRVLACQFLAQRRTALPNPSFEARPNGKPPGPAPGEVYHPSAGPGALPLFPPQLER